MDEPLKIPGQVAVRLVDFSVLGSFFPLSVLKYPQCNRIFLDRGAVRAPITSYGGVCMTLQEVKTILDARVLSGEEHLDREVRSACGSDFMSDVLAYVKNQALLLTGLVNPQVIRTAEMLDMQCIVFVRGKVPGQTMLDMAAERGILIMSTEKPMYLSCGLLYSHGLVGE